MCSERLKKIRVLLMALGLTACQGQTQAQDTYMHKLNGMLSGKVSMAEFSFFYIEEHPMNWTLEFSLAGESNLAHIIKKSKKPGCQEHWNKDCWESTEKRLIVTDVDARSILKLLANSELTHLKSDQILAPGAIGASVKIALPDIAPVIIRMNQQAFSAHSQLGPLRQLILNMTGPVREKTFYDKLPIQQ